MAAARNDRDGVGGKRYGLKSRGTLVGQGRHDEIEIAAAQSLHQDAVIATDNMEAEPRIFGGQLGNNSRHGAAEPRRPGSDPKLADRAACERADLLARILKLNVEQARMPEQRLPLLGQHDPARHPHEQRAVERGFKPPDCLGQARLGDAERLCGGAEAAVARNRVEVADLGEVHGTYSAELWERPDM